MWKYRYSSELCHYGVKGMKWGVRRTPEQLGHAKQKGIDKTEKSSIIRDAIESGEIKKDINKDKQLRHTLHGHSAGKSYLYGDLDFAEDLVNKLSGTGELVFGKGGKWVKKERVVNPNVIGVCVNKETGEESITNKAMIAYSKTGAHIYPRKEKKDDSVG